MSIHETTYDDLFNAGQDAAASSSAEPAATRSENALQPVADSMPSQEITLRKKPQSDLPTVHLDFIDVIERQEVQKKEEADRVAAKLRAKRKSMRITAVAGIGASVLGAGVIALPLYLDRDSNQNSAVPELTDTENENTSTERPSVQAVSNHKTTKITKPAKSEHKKSNRTHRISKTVAKIARDNTVIVPNSSPSVSPVKTPTPSPEKRKTTVDAPASPGGTEAPKISDPSKSGGAVFGEKPESGTTEKNSGGAIAGDSSTTVRPEPSDNQTGGAVYSGN